MDKGVKISLGSEAKIIQEIRHKRGHWGNHGNGDNGWIGYLVVVGICLVSFLFIVCLSN